MSKIRSKWLSGFGLIETSGRSAILTCTTVFCLLLSLSSCATAAGNPHACSSRTCRHLLEQKGHVDTDTDTEGTILDKDGHPVAESEEYNDHDEDDMTPEEWANYQKEHPPAAGMNVEVEDSSNSHGSPSPDPGSLQNVNPDFKKQVWLCITCLPKN